MSGDSLDHDPLCIGLGRERIAATICTFCQLIRHVREDEQRKRWSERHAHVEGKPE